MTQHPFITAVQAALDKHGLPDGISTVMIGTSDIRATGYVHSVWAGSIATPSHGATLAEAVAMAEHFATADAIMRSEEAECRAILAAAGKDPARVTVKVAA